MSRDKISRIHLEFQEIDTGRVLELINSKFEGFKYREVDKGILSFEVNYEVDRSDFDAFNQICDYISVQVFEEIDDLGFIFDKEDYIDYKEETD